MDLALQHQERHLGPHLFRYVAVQLGFNLSVVDHHLWMLLFGSINELLQNLIFEAETITEYDASSLF